MLRRLFGGGDKKHPLEEGAKKMERFTQRARRVLSMAQEEAEHRKDGYIRAEHLLLALLREEESVAGKVLRELGPKPETFESVMQEMATPVESDGSSLQLAKEVMRVLELSVDEARFMGHYWIGTEHLLIGLTRKEGTVAYNALMRLGLTPAIVRKKTWQVVKETPKRTDGKPEVEQAERSEISEKLHLRFVVNHKSNGDVTAQLSMPLKQFADVLNAALKEDRKGKLLALEGDDDTIEIFLDEEDA